MTNKECLFECVSLNLIDRVKVMLDAGYDINSRLSSGDSVMHVAASFSSIEMILFLVRNGADLVVFNDGNQTPYNLSAHNPNPEVKTFFDCLKAFDENLNLFDFYLKGRSPIDAFFAVCVELESLVLYSYFDICMKLISV